MSEEHEEGGGYKLESLATKSFEIMQAEEANPLSTYSNAVVFTVSAPPAKERARRIPWGLIILLTLIISVIIVVYIAISKRKS